MVGNDGRGAGRGRLGIEIKKYKPRAWRVFGGREATSKRVVNRHDSRRIGTVLFGQLAAFQKVNPHGLKIARRDKVDRRFNLFGGWQQLPPLDCEVPRVWKPLDEHVSDRARLFDSRARFDSFDAL